MHSIEPKTIWRALILLFLAVGPGISAAQPPESELPDPERLTFEPLVVRYPGMTEAYGQSRTGYFLEILRLALDKAGRDYVLQEVAMAEFRESRSTMSLAKDLYDIHWMHTNRTREANLLPVRIPLYKGLIGWRLLMVPVDSRDEVAEVRTIDQLRALKVVQGHDWPDADILEHNGFDVVRASSWEGMFKMLYAGRVDIFPRSVIEVWDEAERFGHMNLTVNSNIALHYPTAYYFFVNESNHNLAAIVETGLRRALADGSFEKLFLSHFGDDIRKSRLHERRIIRLKNPLFSTPDAGEYTELWFQP